MTMPNTILLIENSQPSSDSLYQAIQNYGYEVKVTESIESALELLRHQCFDLAITEALFSGLSGLEGITLLKYTQPSIAVIMMTAYATIDLAVNAIKRGADEFLTKPIDTQSLPVIIEKTIKRHQIKPLKEEQCNDKVFSALANPIRRIVVKELALHEHVGFMELCRLTNIDDHTKFNFHLRQLTTSGLVKKLNKKEYMLTDLGKKCCHSLFLMR